MRILFCCHSFAIGGFSSYSLNLSNEFKKKGHEIIFLGITPYGSLYNDFIKSFDKVFIIERKFRTTYNYLLLLEELVVNKIKPDIVINNGVSYIQALFPLLPGHMQRYTVLHSIAQSEVDNAVHFTAFINNTICVSNNIYEKASEVIPIEKLIRIPIGIEPNNNSIEYAKNVKLEIVYVGRITHVAKNLSLMINILHKLKESSIPFNMTFIGDGDYMNTLKGSLVEYNLMDNVQILGSKRPHEISEFLLNKDIFLMTSVYEGMPHALLESMSIGVIPVVSDINGIRDIVKNDENGFRCKIDDPDSFVNVIRRIYENEKLKLLLRANARKLIENHYSIKNIVNKYLELFERNTGKEYPKIDELRFRQEIETISPKLKRYVLTIIGNYYRAYFKKNKPFKY